MVQRYKKIRQWVETGKVAREYTEEAIGEVAEVLDMPST